MTVGWTKNNLFFQYYSMWHCIIVMIIYHFTQIVIRWCILMALFVRIIAMVLETWRIHTFSLIFVPIVYQWLLPYKHVYLFLHKGRTHFCPPLSCESLAIKLNSRAFIEESEEKHPRILPLMLRLQNACLITQKHRLMYQ